MALTKYIAQTVPERVGRAYLSEELRKIQRALDSLPPELDTLREEFHGELADLQTQVDAINASPVWVTPTLLNSWVDYSTLNANYGGTGYYKDPFGIVHVRGLVRGGAPETTIFELLEGYRPSKNLLFACCGVSAGVEVYRRVDVQIDGTIQMRVDSSDFVSLNFSYFAG